MLEGSATHDLIRQAGDISVHVVAGRDKDPGAPKGSIELARDGEFSVAPYLASLAIVGGGARLRPSLSAVSWTSTTSASCS